MNEIICRCPSLLHVLQGDAYWAVRSIQLPLPNFNGSNCSSIRVLSIAIGHHHVSNTIDGQWCCC
jgi:hypothetical protein